MTDQLDRAVADALTRVREQRDALEGAEVKLRQVLEGDPGAAGTIQALQTVEQALHSHATRARGLIELVVEEAPRLHGRARLMMAEHAVLTEAAARLRSDLERGTPLAGLRPAILGLAQTIRSHLAGASDLLWEAVGVDLSPAD